MVFARAVISFRSQSGASLLLRDAFPGMVFSSLAIFDNVSARMHKDSRNAPFPNLLLALTCFQHGEVWCAASAGTEVRQVQETHRGAIDLYCFLCKKVAMQQPSTKLLETSFTLTVCCEPDLILLEQVCPTMFGCRYHDS